MSTSPLAQQVASGEGGADSSSAARGAARPRESLFHLCATADTVRQTPTPETKRALLEPYLGDLDAHTIGPATRILAGTIFPGGEAGPLPVSRTLAVSAIRALTRVSAKRLLDLMMKFGDLGDAAGEVFSGRLPSGLSVRGTESWLRDVGAAPSDAERLPLVRDMLAKLSAIEAQYVVKMLVGDLGIGVDQPLVEQAIANAFNEPVDAIRKAAARSGDIGIAAEQARGHALGE